MKVLISGGAGFLGSNLTERLLAQGQAVLALDNYETGRKDALAPHPALTVVEGDVADGALVARLFRDFAPTHVVHAAAAYKDPDAWAHDARTNVLGTAHVVRAAKEAKVRRFVYLQTALCYGPAKKTPIPDDHPLAPGSSYAISKTGGERYVAMSGLSWVSLRLANVYGPRLYTGPIPAFHKRLRAGQPCSVVRTRRDFVAIDDFLSLMEAVLASEATGAFNASRGTDCTILELYEAMAAILGVQAPPPAVTEAGSDDLASLLLDPSRTMSTFGWRPSVELADGLRRLVEWYDRHGIGQTFTHLRMGKS